MYVEPAATVAINTVGVQNLPLFMSARVGDRVTIVDRFGAERTGRVVMKFRTHLTLNMGGKHGTPGIADESNTVRVRAAR